MKLTAYLFLGVCIGLFSVTGCGGGGETAVIEAPAQEQPDESMGGMDEDEYNEAMNQSLSEQGN